MAVILIALTTRAGVRIVQAASCVSDGVAPSDATDCPAPSAGALAADVFLAGEGISDRIAGVGLDIGLVTDAYRFLTIGALAKIVPHSRWQD